ncbi:LOW QUALITY PROTEIN: hypothetical protein OSB04_012918, partial [Centaurea solstitialis]
MEDPPNSESSSGMLKWMLNKGYGIGTKMVITGIVVSSAPLVLPPLVVFSAMGVAFSVPFGFVFATYACTNKLMTKLLPTPEAPSLLLDQEKQQLEDIKQGIECLDDFRQIDQGGGIVDEKGYYTDQRIGCIEEERADEITFDLAGDGYGKNMEASMTTSVDGNVVQVDERIKDVDHGVVEMRVRLNGHGDECMSKGTRKMLETILRRDDDDDSLEEERRKGDETEEIVRGSIGLLEKIRDQGRREILNDSATEKKAVERESKNNRNMGTQDKSSENEDAISKMKKERQFTHAEVDARGTENVSGLGLFNEGNTSMNLESLEAGDKTNERTANDNVDVEGVMSFKPPPLDSNYVTVASTTVTKTPTREANLDEEKIWENIGAMRAIVGYKAPSEATYVGELKALFAFTGVEPPASFKGDSDLDEVNANLKFLMSIVGV